MVSVWLPVVTSFRFRVMFFQRVADGVAAVLDGDVVDRQLRILGGDRDLHTVAAGTGVIAHKTL